MEGERIKHQALNIQVTTADGTVLCDTKNVTGPVALTYVLPDGETVKVITAGTAMGILGLIKDMESEHIERNPMIAAAVLMGRQHGFRDLFARAGLGMEPELSEESPENEEEDHDCDNCPIYGDCFNEHKKAR